MRVLPRPPEALNRITKAILQASISVHQELGPGLLESVYHYCLAKELRNRGLRADSALEIELHYKGEALGKKFIIDLLVEESVIVELKAVDEMAPVYSAQIISYLKLADARVGLLINFNVPVIKDGFKRFVNGL